MSWDGINKRREPKADNLIWWLMISFFGIIILGGGAWATNINSKVDKIAGLEANIQYIQKDLSEIKQILQIVVKNRGL